MTNWGTYKDCSYKRASLLKPLENTPVNTLPAMFLQKCEVGGVLLIRCGTDTHAHTHKNTKYSCGEGTEKQLKAESHKKHVTGVCIYKPTAGSEHVWSQFAPQSDHWMQTRCMACFKITSECSHAGSFALDENRVLDVLQVWSIGNARGGKGIFNVSGAI